MPQRTTPAMGRSLLAPRLEQQDNDDGHRDIDYDHGHGMSW